MWQKGLDNHQDYSSSHSLIDLCPAKNLLEWCNKQQLNKPLWMSWANAEVAAKNDSSTVEPANMVTVIIIAPFHRADYIDKKSVMTGPIIITNSASCISFDLTLNSKL